MAERTIAAHIRHLMVDALAREASRKAHRNFVSELEFLRPGSFPLVSADTFRAIANVRIENRSLTKRARLFSHDVVFLDMRLFESPARSLESTRRLVELQLDQLEDKRNSILIIANADIPPPLEFLLEYQQAFRHVYCTNVVEESVNLTAIPVGVENLYRFRNGRLKDFLEAGPKKDRNRKKWKVFSHFNVANNDEIRRPLAHQLEQSRFGWPTLRLSPELYRQSVAQSLFVISPPGSGIDCHRTWEAIYLGSVPVILKGYLARSLIAKLPILEVESYPAFLASSDSELDELYDLTMEKKPEAAYMPYWVRKIGNFT